MSGVDCGYHTDECRGLWVGWPMRDCTNSLNQLLLLNYICNLSAPNLGTVVRSVRLDVEFNYLLVANIKISQALNGRCLN